MKDKNSVFISYSSKDVNVVGRVIRTLKRAGISYWKAPEMIPVGSNYAREIPKVISECEVFLLIISDNSQKSIWVEKEIDYAINNRKTIVPLKVSSGRLGEVFSFYLNNVQMVNYQDGTEEALELLRRRITGILEKSAKENKTDIDVSETDNKKEENATSEIKQLEIKQSVIEKSKIEQSEIDRLAAAKVEEHIKPSSVFERPQTNQASIFKEPERPQTNQASIFKRPEKSQIKQIQIFKRPEQSDKSAAKPELAFKRPEKKESLESEQQRILRSQTVRRKRTSSIVLNPQPRNCQYCNGSLEKISSGRYKCRVCKKENYDYFQTVRNYLDENGPSSILKIEDQTGIPRESIEYFLRQEKLEIPKNCAIRLVCEKCGAAIRTGCLCEKCKNGQKR